MWWMWGQHCTVSAVQSVGNLRCDDYRPCDFQHLPHICKFHHSHHIWRFERVRLACDEVRGMCCPIRREFDEEKNWPYKNLCLCDGQIHKEFWTNIYFTIWRNTFCNLSNQFGIWGGGFALEQKLVFARCFRSPVTTHLVIISQQTWIAMLTHSLQSLRKYLHLAKTKDRF